MGSQDQPPPRLGGDAYFLPRHPAEVPRLDVQHYALREALRANYLAPLERPSRIVDVGCGTGQWAFDLCAEFSEAMVVGLDLEPSKPEPPANYRMVRGNVLQGLPFRDGAFDFVHERFMTAGVPLSSWAAFVRELVRVARPGGWVELIEGGPEVEPTGPASRRLAELARRAGGSFGLDAAGVIARSLGDSLRRAGAEEVQDRSLEVPMGEWGGRIGSLMASDYRAGFTRLCDVFGERFGVSREECSELLQAMQQEWERHRSTTAVSIAFGQRPG